MTKKNIVTIEMLNARYERTLECIRDRERRIANCEVESTDCFLSARADADRLRTIERQREILENGGLAWLWEYATLDNQLVEARWVDTRYGRKLVAEMPDGSTVWTTAQTAKGLAKKGLKEVRCLRPAWAESPRELWAAKWNRATGEDAAEEPVEIDWDCDRVVEGEED